MYNYNYNMYNYNYNIIGGYYIVSPYNGSRLLNWYFNIDNKFSIINLLIYKKYI